MIVIKKANERKYQTVITNNNGIIICILFSDSRTAAFKIILEIARNFIGAKSVVFFDETTKQNKRVAYKWVLSKERAEKLLPSEQEFKETIENNLNEFISDYGQ